jgi:hypothetical protein
MIPYSYNRKQLHYPSQYGKKLPDIAITGKFLLKNENQLGKIKKFRWLQKIIFLFLLGFFQKIPYTGV